MCRDITNMYKEPPPGLHIAADENDITKVCANYWPSINWVLTDIYLLSNGSISGQFYWLICWMLQPNPEVHFSAMDTNRPETWQWFQAKLCLTDFPIGDMSILELSTYLTLTLFLCNTMPIVRCQKLSVTYAPIKKSLKYPPPPTPQAY